MNDNIKALLPRNKLDTKQANAVVARGYPAVASILPELFTWIQDCNWPVAHIIAPFLASIGLPVVPYVKNVLLADDNIWKYWVLGQVVAQAPHEVAEQLCNDLTRLAANPTPNEMAENVQEVAQAILSQLDRGAA